MVEGAEPVLPPWLRLREGAVELRVRLNPGAARAGVQGPYGDRLRISVTAQPVGEAANRALAALVARAADRPRNEVRIVVGARSRSKTVLVGTPTPGLTAGRLSRVLGTPAR